MKNPKKQAFTLIEIMIASLIFSIAMIVATAIFTNTIGARSKVEVTRDTVQGGRLAMEEITRNVRLANGGYDSSGGKSAFSIIYDSTKQTLTVARTDPTVTPKTYSFKTYSRCDENKDGVFSICVYNNIDAKTREITSSSVNVTNFSLVGTIPDSYPLVQQPKVNITFTIQPAKADSKVTSQNTLTLSTTVSSRDYNVLNSPGIGR